MTKTTDSIMIRNINPAFGDTDPSVTFESVEEMAAAILACGPEFSLPEDGLREGRDYETVISENE